MDKIQALEVLIKHSYFLIDEVKEALLKKIPEFSPEEIDQLGTFLALEKQKSLENNQKVICNVDTILAGIENPNLLKD